MLNNLLSEFTQFLGYLKHLDYLINEAFVGLEISMFSSTKGLLSCNEDRTLSLSLKSSKWSSLSNLFVMLFKWIKIDRVLISWKKRTDTNIIGSENWDHYGWELYIASSIIFSSITCIWYLFFSFFSFIFSIKVAHSVSICYNFIIKFSLCLSVSSISPDIDSDKVLNLFFSPLRSF